jgi:hypothetical protein
MADHEVAKHTKKMYKIWNSSEHGFWHKFKEFFIEISIIIFAVTVSIWFHNIAEKRHDRAEAKQFLIGFKTDLQKDTAEMIQDSLSYHLQYDIFSQILDSPDHLKDSNLINQNNWVFLNTTVLIPNISRFEALKYSGKMNTIENKELLDEIINLYEEKIPKLVNSGNNTSNFKINALQAYIEEKNIYSANPLREILPYINSDKKLNYVLRRYIRSCVYIKALYKEVILQNIKLINMIDEELKK